MRVMVIVKASPSSEAGEMPSTQLLTEMGNFNEELVNAGIMLAGEGLHPSSQGARVCFSGTSRTVIDGPFAETKELIAGYWIWKVGSMQEAIDWVKKCPNPMMEDSEIEIRRIFEAEDFGDEFTPELREQEAAIRAKSMSLGDLRFEDAAARTIGGNSQHYTKETRPQIPQQWEQFVAAADTVPDRTGSDYFGVCWNCGPNCSFDYLTGVEVSGTQGLKGDLQSVVVPARRYAVFTHSGHVSKIGETIDKIWTEWAPECGLKLDEAAPCFEKYSDDYDATTGMGGMEIWLPLA